MVDEILLEELKGNILCLTLNRPKANAFNSALIKACTRAITAAGSRPEIKVVLLTGSGTIFSAGQDLGEVAAAQGISFGAHLEETYNPLIRAIRALPKPMIALINGPIAGAALGVALACDLRIASDRCKFMVGFNGIGLAPDSAISLLLPAYIGLGRATQATYFNEPISSEQALSWGMVNHVVADEQLESEGMAWAAKLAAGPTEIYALTKSSFNQAVLSNLEAVLAIEAQTQEQAGNSKQHAEGLAAFLEKRPPRYS